MVQRNRVLFKNRFEAGKQLADLLEDYEDTDPVILGIPRGGIPVATAVAETLNAELDVMVAKKLEAPDNPELAIGAVGEDMEPYLNEDVVESLAVGDDYITDETKKQYKQVEELISEIRDVVEKSTLRNRTAILVDDGIATGATARACLEISGRKGPETIVLAVPVAPTQTIKEFRTGTCMDRLVCLEKIDGFFGGIGGYYRDFDQVSSDEVRETLRHYGQVES